MTSAADPAGTSSATAERSAPNGYEPRHARVRSLGMVHNSVALIAAKVAIMGLGFLFWLVAARQFDQHVVGLTAAAVSAVMLCTQLALFGIGSAFITSLPEHRRDPARLVNAAVTLAAIAATVVALVLIVLSGAFLRELSVLADDPLFALSFVIVGVAGTVGVLLDQISTALRRGDQALVRNVLSGGVTLGHLVVLAVLAADATADALFATWLTGGLVVIVVGWIQLKRCIAAYRYRPSLERRLRRPLLGIGLPNHVLTLTERVPGFVLPIVVTELLSPAANAHWYTAWMMAWVVYIIPIQVGMTLFAEASDEPHDLAVHVRRGIRISLVLGVAAAAAAAVLAPIALGLLGRDYGASATTPLRILVIGVLPLTVIQAYFAICRATRKLREAIAVGTATALAGTAAATAAGVVTGLGGMATAWVVTQAIAALWAAFRLRSLLRRLESERRGNVQFAMLSPVKPGLKP
jgi:O-antigen/teichoic acid export membrane protein